MGGRTHRGMAAFAVIRLVLLHIVLCHGIGAWGSPDELTEVDMTAGGAMHARSHAATESLMRRQKEHGHHQQHHGDVHSDHHRHAHHAHHKHHKKHTAHIGARAAEDEMLEADSSDNDAVTPTAIVAPTLVSCGGHQSQYCRLCGHVDHKKGCTTIDEANGCHEMADANPHDACHGDCHYYDGECHKLTSANLHVKRHRKQNNSNVPNLLNPNITDADRELMDKAADAAVAESQYESGQRQAAVEQKAERRKNTVNNFVWVSIIAGSSCLYCCAIASCVVLCLWQRSTAPKEPKLLEEEDVGGDDEGDEEDEEAEDEAPEDSPAEET